MKEMMKARPGTVDLCRILMNTRGKIISGGTLSGCLSCSRQTVWKSIRSLVEEGFSIESIPQKGYILHDLPRYDLAPSYIGALLQNTIFSQTEIYLFDTLSSTQETAKQLARQSGKENVVVISEEQTKGRGRRDRTWISQHGSGLFLSFFFKPRLFPGKLQLVNLAAGLAVRDAVGKTCAVKLALKWPNDLLWENKKVCGILSEASSESDRVRDCCTGIGLNIISPPLENNKETETVFSRAAFLNDMTGGVHRGVLAAALLDRFTDILIGMENDGGKSLLERYRKECATLGREIVVITDGGTERGQAVGIGENGELFVINQRGTVAYCAADVVHATPEGC